MTNLKVNHNYDVVDISKLTKLKILDLSYCDNIYDDQLINLTNLRELISNGNCNISKINHLTKLDTLIIGGDDGNGITTEGISNLINLTHLNYLNNHESDDVSDLNKFTNLKVLIMSCSNKMTNNGISKLTNLEKLDISYFETPIELDHFIYLTSLRACEMEGNDEDGNLNNESISKLTNLIELDISYNHSITNLNTLTNLQTLDIDGCGIETEGLSGLINLTKLDYQNVEDVNFNLLTKLKILSCNGGYINSNSISLLTNLSILSVNNCAAVRSLNNLKGLKELYANDRCGIINIGISDLTNLEILNINNNPGITNIDFAIKLKVLNISRNSNVTNNSLLKLTNLIDLETIGNWRVNDVRSLTNLTKLNGCRLK